MSAVLTKTFVHYLGQGLFAWVPHWEPYAMALAIGIGFVIGQSAFQAGSLAGSVAGIEAAEPIASVALGWACSTSTLRSGPRCRQSR